MVFSFCVGLERVSGSLKGGVFGNVQDAFGADKKIPASERDFRIGCLCGCSPHRFFQTVHLTVLIMKQQVGREFPNSECGADGNSFPIARQAVGAPKVSGCLKTLYTPRFPPVNKDFMP